MNDEAADAGPHELAHLRAIALAILAAGTDLGAALVPVQDLRLLAERLSALEMSAPGNLGDGASWLPSGLAVSPFHAALCAREFLRSAAFIQGASRAMEQAALHCGGRPIRVLYAGCGPFAFLLLPMLALWPPERARFTMVDIHTEALAPARRLVAALGLDASVTSWIQADAATVRLDPDALPDVIVSETMSAALKREPQVAITRNLLFQAPGALMVPASVRVDCVLSERPDASAAWRDTTHLGHVFALDAAAASGWDAGMDGTLPAATITLPDDIAPHATLRLTTDITVFDDVVLTEGDCSLNARRHLPGKPLLAAGQKVRFHYRLGADPGIDYSLLPA